MNLVTAIILIYDIQPPRQVYYEMLHAKKEKSARDSVELVYYSASPKISPSSAIMFSSSSAQASLKVKLPALRVGSG